MPAIVCETCTLLVARKHPHLVERFLDYLEESSALLVTNPDEALTADAKNSTRRQAEHGCSFMDCLSFCTTKERRILNALTTDEHFRKADFSALIVG